MAVQDILLRERRPAELEEVAKAATIDKAECLEM